jgi:hypothetical protein
MNKLFAILDGNRIPVSGLNAPDHTDLLHLTANVAKEYTIPAGAKNVYLSATENIFVKIGGAASIPETDVLDGSAPELNPGLRTLAGATVGFISQSNCIVTISIYN